MSKFSSYAWTKQQRTVVPIIAEVDLHAGESTATQWMGAEAIAFELGKIWSTVFDVPSVGETQQKPAPLASGSNPEQHVH